MSDQSDKTTTTHGQSSLPTPDPLAAGGDSTSKASPPVGKSVPVVLSWRKKMLSAVGDTFKALIPAHVSKLEDKYGPAVFVGFCLGFTFGISLGAGALMKSDSLRTLLLPVSQSTPTASHETVPGEKLSDIKFSPAKGTPQFLADYERLLSDFGEEGKPQGMADNPPLGVVVREFTKPTLEFNFSLRPRFEGSQIHARLFRQTTLAGREIYEPLFPLSDSSANVMKFKVRECSASDKLFMVVLVIPQSQTAEGTRITDYFDTQLE